MFIVFGDGKCPFCGDFGREKDEKIYHCEKCVVSFNSYYISKHSVINEEEGNKFWN